MRAAVVRKPGTIEIEQIDRPRPGPGEVLVKVVATGVCRSDLSAFLGKVPVPLPVVLGHEGAGIVEELGAGVDDLEPGDRSVALHFSLYMDTAKGRDIQPDIRSLASAVHLRQRSAGLGAIRALDVAVDDPDAQLAGIAERLEARTNVRLIDVLRCGRRLRNHRRRKFGMDNREQ